MPLSAVPSSVKAGTVAHFAASTAPSGWIKCNGSAVSRTAYAALFAAIGTTYGAGDGVTTFAVPDLRGEFLRGLDDGRGVDTGRAIGSAQAGQMPSHTHSYNITNVGIGGSFGGNGAGSQSANTGTAGGTGNASENRPRNVAMLACIKF